MIRLLCTIALVGVLVWALVTLVPMPAPFDTIVIAVAVIGIVLYVVQAFGVDLPLPGRRNDQT